VDYPERQDLGCTLRQNHVAGERQYQRREQRLAIDRLGGWLCRLPKILDLTGVEHIQFVVENIIAGIRFGVGVVVFGVEFHFGEIVAHRRVHDIIGGFVAAGIGVQPIGQRDDSIVFRVHLLRPFQLSTVLQRQERESFIEHEIGHEIRRSPIISCAGRARYTETESDFRSPWESGLPHWGKSRRPTSATPQLGLLLLSPGSRLRPGAETLFR
jgi:hypothetical protein